MTICENVLLWGGISKRIMELSDVSLSLTNANSKDLFSIPN